MNKDIIDLAQKSDVLSLIYSDALSPSVSAIGNAIGEILNLSMSFSLPIKLLNERIRLNFKKRLDEYADKLKEIPETKRCSVHPQIGFPVVEKLSYTTTDEIADLYTSLLASASSIETENRAHPSFISMIEHLSVDEAQIIRYLKYHNKIPYCEVQGFLKDQNGYNAIVKYLTDLEDRIKLLYPENIEVYLDNLIGQGILRDRVGVYLLDDNNYCTIIQNKSIFEEKYVPSVYKSIEFSKSYFELTSVGKLFINACIKDR